MSRKFHKTSLIFIPLLNLFNLINVESFAISPSLQPLRFVDVGVVGQFVCQEIQSKLIGSVLPADLNDAVAVALSEGRVYTK